jgi:HEAT repeat protein
MQWLTLSQIKSSDVERRIQAIETLAREPDVKALLALMRALSDSSPRVRVAAAQVLGPLRDERCIQPLIGLLCDTHPGVREAGVRALKAMGHASAVPHLVPLLQDATPAVRVSAAAALNDLHWTPGSELEEAHYHIAAGQFVKAAAFGAIAVPPLLIVLADEASSKRRLATEALAQIDDPRALEAIARMTDDPDSGVRVVALGALGRARSKADAYHVRRQLQHPDKNVRACALEALVKIGQPDLLTVLEHALRDSHWTVRVAAAAALGRSGDANAVEPLLQVISDPDADVRQVVAEALGRLRDPRAIEPLILAQLDPDNRVRQSMMTALQHTDYNWARSEQAQRMLDPLKEALKHQNYEIRHTAAKLLNQITNMLQCEPSIAADMNADTVRRQSAVNVLAATLLDEDPLVRFVSVWTLRQIGDPRAIQSLSARLQDTDQCVRTAAEEALASLGANGHAPSEEPLSPPVMAPGDDTGTDPSPDRAA